MKNNTEQKPKKPLLKKAIAGESRIPSSLLLNSFKYKILAFKGGYLIHFTKFFKPAFKFIQQTYLKLGRVSTIFNSRLFKGLYFKGFESPILLYISNTHISNNIIGTISKEFSQ